jgi:cation diffusion facilitator family transporter
MKARPDKSSKRTIYAALIGNLLIAVTKFIAATITGSSAMLSEGVHSLVDTSNEILLLYGLRRSAKGPDAEHPLGYGRELYFWSFIVALLVFALGAGVSLYEGVIHIMAPEPVRNPAVNYVVLALSFCFEGASWWVAVSQFRSEQLGKRGYLDAVRESKDPVAFTVMLEDSAALIGIVLAAAGIFAADFFAMPELDGAGSIGIGLLLAVTAIFLARESKGLLIGERADPELEADILDCAGRDPAILKANGVITVHLAPDQIVASLSAEFCDNVSADDIEACVERLERQLAERRQQVTVLFVKPQSARRWLRGQNGEAESLP